MKPTSLLLSGLGIAAFGLVGCGSGDEAAAAPAPATTTSANPNASPGAAPPAFLTAPPATGVHTSGTSDGGGRASAAPVASPYSDASGGGVQSVKSGEAGTR